MKKILCVIMVLALLFLASCTGKTSEENASSALNEETVMTSGEVTEADGVTSGEKPAPEEITTVESLTVNEEEAAGAMVIYFSHNDPIATAAQYISEKTKGTVHRIETVAEYPDNEGELVKKANEEHLRNARPALKNSPKSMSDYDIVFLCFPAWDNTMPMALFTFIEDFDMREKAVIPVIYGSKSALDNAVQDIHSLVPSMMIAGGYSFGGDFLAEKTEFDAWLDTVLYG